MPIQRPLFPRLRGGAVGAATAGTGIVAHSAGHGMLPSSSALLILAAAGTLIGMVATRASLTRILLLAILGQSAMHLILTALGGHSSGAHSSGSHSTAGSAMAHGTHAADTALISPPMATAHVGGLLVTLILVACVDLLARLLSALAVAVLIAIAWEPRDARTRRIPAIDTAAASGSTAVLGRRLTRGPPLTA